jgi:hypothetical protein
MLHRVASGEFTPPQHAGPLTAPLMQMLAPDPADRPTMPAVRDQLAKLAAGPDRDVTEVLTARTQLPKTLPGLPARPPGTEAPPASPVTPAPAAPPVRRPPVRTGAEPPAAAPRHRPTAQPMAAGSSGGRRRWLAVLGALLLVAAVAAVAVVLLNGDGNPTAGAQGGSTSAPPPSSAPPSSSAPGTTAQQTTAQTTAAQSTAQTTAPTTTTAPASAVAGAPTAAQLQAAVQSYYALLPGNPEAAWERTGPTLRQAESHDNYIRFWNRFSAVTLGPVSARDGSLVVTARVTFVQKDGGTSPEQHTITLIQDDGQLLIDSDVPG